MAAKVRIEEGLAMKGKKPRIDKGVPKKGINKTERTTIITIKKQERAGRKLLKGI